MFQWDKSIRILDVPADRVVQLFRSMRDVQLALPGLPAQEASAYLCQHQAAEKIATTVVFHLLTSGQLAFYVDAPREVAAEQATKAMDQALTFIESMGFLMTDLDLHLLDAADREMLWASLPLPKGAAVPGETAPAAPAPVGTRRPSPVRRSVAEPPPVAAAAVQLEPPPADQPAATRATPEPVTAPSAAEQGGIDDLLAAVEALRARRPETRSHRKPPGREELQRRRRELTASLGRILASL